MDRRLRVLHLGKFYPPVPGGMEVHLEQLCRGLANTTDVEVLIANTGRATVREQRGGVSVTRLGTLFEFAKTSFSPSLPAQIRKSTADIVHLHHPNPAAALALLVSGNSTPLVITYHSDIVAQRWLRHLAHPILRRVFERAEAILTTSEAYLRTSRFLEPYRHKCHVVPLAIDLDTLLEPGPIVPRVERNGRPIILGVGRQVYYKGFEHAIRAMTEVDGLLMLVGDGPLRKRLEQIAHDAGVSGRVEFLGSVADVRPYFRAASVFVLPSVARSEAFGIVQLEAMAHGVPVVNTDLDTGVPSVSLDGLTGFTVPPKNPRALAEAINRLLGDEQLRARMGEAGRRRVHEEFNVSQMVEKTRGVYRAVAG